MCLESVWIRGKSGHRGRRIGKTVDEMGNTAIHKPGTETSGRACPHCPQTGHILLTPYSQTSDFHNCETVHFWGLSHSVCGTVLQQQTYTNVCWHASWCPTCHWGPIIFLHSFFSFCSSDRPISGHQFFFFPLILFFFLLKSLLNTSSEFFISFLCF